LTFGKGCCQIVGLGETKGADNDASNPHRPDAPLGFTFAQISPPEAARRTQCGAIKRNDATGVAFELNYSTGLDLTAPSGDIGATKGFPMALPVRDQLTYWGLATATLFVVLWVLGNVLLPFVMGGAIAYLLDPTADRLERLGLSRVLATATITLVAGLAFVLAALLVAPVLVEQLA